MISRRILHWAFCCAALALICARADTNRFIFRAEPSTRFNFQGFAGDRIKANLHLVRAVDGQILWSGDFDAQLSDVFGVQEQIARAVVDSLHVRVDSRTREALVGRPTRDPEAYDLYLQGRSRAVIRGREHLDSAVAFFTRATKRGPSAAS